MLTSKEIADKQALYVKAKHYYYNTDHPIMTDEAFDALEEELRIACPDWIALEKTGTARKKTDVLLPYYMPSLNKMYPEAVDRLWRKFDDCAEVIYMQKLDGNSVMVVYSDGKLKSLYTRGNGEFGKDISFLIPFTNLPKYLKRLDDHTTHFFRAEAIISKPVFAKKYAGDFDNARNMVAGILNRTLDKVNPDIVYDIDFVFLGEYERPLGDFFHEYEPDLQSNIIPPFKVVYHYTDKKHQERAFYKLFKTDDTYEADGVVIADPAYHYDPKSADKPTEGIFAYKENPVSAEVVTEVVDVIWQVSAFGRFTPKVQVTPVRIGTATVQYATLHNAQWMIDNKIGIGSKIALVRSGDVIPKVVRVIEPSDKLVFPTRPFVWKGVHLMMPEDDLSASVVIMAKRIVRGLELLGVEGIKENTVFSLLSNSEFDGISLKRFLLLVRDKPQKTESLMMTVLGDVRGEKLFKAVQEVVLDPGKLPVYRWMLACDDWPSGVGERTLKRIAKEIPLLDLLQGSKESIKSYLMALPGFQEATAELTAQAFQAFKDWNADGFLKLTETAPQESAQTKALSGLRITFTGYRDKEQEAFLEANGAEIAGFSSKTDWLLFKEGGKKSSKIEKAGARAISFEMLLARYGLTYTKEQGETECRNDMYSLFS